jgi:subtilisin family serine protease
MSHARVPALLATVALALVALPDSRATVAADGQRQVGQVGPRGVAVPRDQRPPSPMRRDSARVQAMIEARQQHLDYVPGEVIVKFRDGMSPIAQQRALSTLASKPNVSALEWHGRAALLHDSTQRDARVLAQQLSAQPEVEYAEPNYILRLSPREEPVPFDAGELHPAAAPNDPGYASQWNFSSLDMAGAWDINPGGSADIVVAVVDTGVTVVNQSFAFPIWNGSLNQIQTVNIPFTISPGMSPARLRSARDFAFWNNAVFDTDGHGTHVASTIAETTNDNAGAAGIAYNVVIMPVKVCTGYWDEQILRSQAGISGRASEDDPGCFISDIADGIEYAANQGAKVINLSLGGPNQSNRLRDALTFAVQRGAFIAIAMGNNFTDGNETNYPAKYAETIQGAMSVAAVGRQLGTRAPYSATGSYCEIAAPGGDRTPGPDNGVIFQTTVDEPSHTSNSPRFDQFDVFGITGTSMATPHVSGLAALIMSQQRGITPAQVESIIRDSAHDIGRPGKDDEFGYGLIQPRTALFGKGIRK